MRRRLGAIQSCYLPWKGYFDFIKSVDIFILADDELYSHSGFRNRNLLRTPHGTEWITLPVHATTQTRIADVPVADHNIVWRRRHARQIRSRLGTTSCFSDLEDILAFYTRNCSDMLSDINQELLRIICQMLEIKTPVESWKDKPVQERKTEKIIRLLEEYDCNTYVTGPSAMNYIDIDALRVKNLHLEIKSYDYESYQQRWSGYWPDVSVLDLIANCGIRESRRLMCSRTPDQVVL